MFHMVV